MKSAEERFEEIRAKIGTGNVDDYQFLRNKLIEYKQQDLSQGHQNGMREAAEICESVAHSAALRPAAAGAMRCSIRINAKLQSTNPEPQKKEGEV